MNNTPSVPLRTFFCPCCGSTNTKIAHLEKVTYEEPDIPPSTKVEVWCYNCPDPIMIQVIVPKEFQPHPDVGTYNVMEPLKQYLKQRAHDQDNDGNNHER